MTPAETPAVILLPDGTVLLTYPDGSAVRIELDGRVAVVHTDYAPFDASQDRIKLPT